MYYNLFLNVLYFLGVSPQKNDQYNYHGSAKYLKNDFILMPTLIIFADGKKSIFKNFN